MNSHNITEITIDQDIKSIVIRKVKEKNATMNQSIMKETSIL